MWYKLLENEKAIEFLQLKEAALENVYLHEVTLHEDGPFLNLRLDINEYPRKSPRKWIISGFNTVQINLELWGVSDLIIKNWKCVNIIDINLFKRNEIIELITTGCPRITCKAEYVRVGKISAYQNDKEVKLLDY